MWGVYDTKDNVWIGDDNGPKLFDEQAIARIAAQVFEVQLDLPRATLQARECAEQPLRLRDEVSTKMDALTALKGIEEGRFV